MKIETCRYEANLLNNCQTAVEPNDYKLLALIGEKKNIPHLLSDESICSAMAHDNLYDDNWKSWMTTCQLLYSEMMHRDSVKISQEDSVSAESWQLWAT